MTARGPVSVHIPPQGSDRPSWVKVGVIAVVGFAVGVAWPRLAGIRPGPSAPGESAASSARAPESPAAGGSPAALAGGGSGTAPTAASSAPAAAAASESAGALANAPPAVLVTRGAVLTCKTAEGEVLKGPDKCGTLQGFDPLAQPRLKRLAACPAAHGASGKLTVVFNLDFTRNKIGFTLGKSTSVENKDSLEQCLRESFDRVSLNAVGHDNPLYGVFYSVTFTPRDAMGGAAAASLAAEQEVTAPQTAQVAWEVAIVRDSPRTGSVIGRLQRGTRVRVGNGQDGWFRVKYGSDFGSEGWVYRGAIGK